MIYQYGYEFYKAKQVIASRDIAYAFTNLQANDYFSFSALGLLLLDTPTPCLARLKTRRPRYLSLTSVAENYDNFCLFCHIENSTKRKDDLAFFVFFTFKGEHFFPSPGPGGLAYGSRSQKLTDDTDWKRLILADGPRQSINALLLYAFGTANGWQTHDIPAWWNYEPITAMLLFAMIATVLIFAGSMVLLIAASVMYVPLLCYIQGNLKGELSNFCLS